VVKGRRNMAEGAKDTQVDRDWAADRSSSEVRVSLSDSGATLVRGSPVKHMRWIDGGAFLMGSDNFYPEERPVHHGGRAGA
jgi:hypothetical protein